MTDMLRQADLLDKPLLARGKVRDLFDLGDKILIVVTDRISAFDVVFDELIPQKGIVLNKIAEFWFEKLRDVIDNHVIATDPAQYPAGLSRYSDLLAGRSMLVKKIKMLPVECIVRGYLEGSALKEYKASGSVAGIKMPDGLVQADRLPEPVFTPSTKAESGHDENITYAQMTDLIGRELSGQVRQKSLELYAQGAAHSAARGLILADTKFEFGLDDSGRLLVADELLTPDSSRFWEASYYKPGGAQKSFDKQYLRDWLEKLTWDKNPPPPALPDTVIEMTAAKYREAYRRITGESNDHLSGD